MKKIFLILCLVVTGFSANAYINGPIKGLAKPSVTIVMPHGWKARYQERIYTPDRYHCYIKNTRKYCADRRGNGINGRIVTADEASVAYENYQNGYQSGITSVFDNFGVMLRQSDYKRGVKHGEEIVYFTNGNVKFKKHYKDGALDGRVEQYDINGALLGKMNYKNGYLRDGYCKNESANMSMKERLKKEHYNEVLPCGSVKEE